MPWTPAQMRLFGAQKSEGKISKKEFDKRAHEGTRKDVDKTGHAKTKAAKKSRRSSRGKSRGRRRG